MFIHLFMAPPKRKHCGTTPERWMKSDPPLRAINITMPLLLFTSHHRVPQLDYMTYRGVLKRNLGTRGKTAGNRVSTTSIIYRSSVVQMDRWSILKIVTYSDHYQVFIRVTQGPQRAKFSEEVAWFFHEWRWLWSLGLYTGTRYQHRTEYRLAKYRWIL